MLFAKTDPSGTTAASATAPRGPVVRRLRRGAWVLILLSVLPAKAQLSPGPLSRAHSDLKGALKCLQCHGSGSATLDRQCLACHEGIAWLVTHGRGLHAREAGKDCSGCHPDHVGRDFSLIEWEEGTPQEFDHQRTGWPLSGKHASIECEDCHKPTFRTSPAAALSKSKRPARSWIGLEPACLSCHRDYHQNALGPDCSRCHSLANWKPAPLFDHDASSYPLTGKHVGVECGKCHMAPRLDLPRDARGKPMPLYKPLAHEKCSTCHEDVHQGRLSGTCSECHETTGFLAHRDPQFFDHDLTRYPLRGAHRKLQCADCHGPQVKRVKTPRYDTCGACHQDPHGGRATLGGRIVDCASCHRVQGFRPSTYTVAQHKQSDYPLEGKHAEVRCESCHPKNPAGVPREQLGKANVLLRRAHDRCTDCHADDHGGQLAEREHKGACESCHRVDGFKPSTFTAEDHGSLKLALVGRHAAVECVACHGSERKGLPALPDLQVLGKARLALVLEDSRCVACHVDPHLDRFGPEGDRPQAEGCLACHGWDAFRPSTIDVETHGEFGHALVGAHRAVACIECHEELTMPATGSTLLLTRERSRLYFDEEHGACRDCHETVHGDQFDKRPDRGACETCHEADAFRPATRFDHNLHAAFPLEGQHTRVPCVDCHPSTVDVDGRERVKYTPIPIKCEACHRGKPVGPLTASPGPPVS